MRNGLNSRSNILVRKPDLKFKKKAFEISAQHSRRWETSSGLSANAVLASLYLQPVDDAKTLQRGRQPRRPAASLQWKVNTPSTTQTQLRLVRNC